MMKRFILTTAILLLTAIFSFAQNETLLSGDIDHGGFGGLTTTLSQINNFLGVSLGGYDALLIDHSIVLGVGGRVVSGTGINVLNNNDFSSPPLSASVRFGGF